MRPKKKKGPHSNSGKKFGKILKIQKNTLENSEKYLEKFGKLLQKIRKNTLKNSEKYSQKSGSRTQNHFSDYAIGAAKVSTLTDAVPMHCQC